MACEPSSTVAGAGAGAGAGTAPTGDPASTFSYQSTLPRLPVPPLDATLDTFLTLVRPLAQDAAEVARVEALVGEFRDGPGPKLQAALEARAAACAKVPYESTEAVSWLEEWWDRVAYLMGRDPLPVNINVFSSCNNASTYPDPCERAAIMANSTAINKTLIEANTLPVDMLGRGAKAQPLCMHMFKRVYGVTRVPGVEVDAMEVHPESRHIVVIRDGELYELDVLHEDGTPVAVADLRHAFRAIVEASNVARDAAAGAGAGANIAMLTYDTRPAWARAREHLLKNPVNRASLRSIEKALWVMTLSREEPANHEELVNLALHGNGEIWADKSMNLIVAANGMSGFNGEHGATDGSVVTRVMLDCRRWEAKHKFDPATSPSESPGKPRLLAWEGDATLDAALASATASADSLRDDLDATCSVFTEFGKDFIKSVGLSPDSFAQMAMQLAQYRDQGALVATYESAITRLFCRGRTETIRPLSPDSRDFVRAMDDPTISVHDKIAKLRQAVRTHQAYVRRCMAGQAIDRHLLGLRLLAGGGGVAVPLFEDPLFARFNDFTLSTSQIAYPSVEFCGFGPPTPPAYGVCYNCSLSDKLITIVTARHSCESKDAKRFTKVLEGCFRDVAQLMRDGDAAPVSKL